MQFLLIGLALGLLITVLVQFLNKNSIQLRWYEWLLVGVGVFLIVFNIDTFVYSRAELEPKAANLSLLFLGLPGLIFVVLGLRLAYSRAKSRASKDTMAA